MLRYSVTFINPSQTISGRLKGDKLQNRLILQLVSWKAQLKSSFFKGSQNLREVATPNRKPAKRVRFGSEEQQNERAMSSAMK